MATASSEPNMREKGISLLNKATEADNNQNYEDALSLYQNALQYLIASLKYEKNTSLKDALQEKVREILERAEHLKEFIKNHRESTGSSGNVVTAKKGSNETPKDQDSHLREALQSTILKERPNVLWSDVAGLESAKDALKEAVILPMKAPQLFESRLEPWAGILLYGPPGTGKTQLARAVATQCQSAFFAVKTSDLVSKFVGESERLINQLFTMARQAGNAVIFIDEIESLTGTRKDSDNEASARIKTEFLQQMDGLSKNKGIVVLAATNLPWTIDSGILRRFQRLIYIPLPEEETRSTLVALCLKNVPHNLTKNDFQLIAQRTNNFSGSDLKNLAQDARYEAARALKHATHFKQIKRQNPATKQEDVVMIPCSPGDEGAVEMSFETLEEKNLLSKLDLPPVCFRDFERALTRTRSTIKMDDVKRCEEFTQQYGSIGQ